MVNEYNSVAKHIVDYIEKLLQDNEELDPNSINLFMDYDDLRQRSPSYWDLFHSGLVEEANKLPDVPSSFSFGILKYCHRRGVSLHVYTTRVDVSFVHKTCASIKEAYKTPNLFKTVIPLVLQENEYHRKYLSEEIPNEIIPNDKTQTIILFSDYESENNNFKNAPALNENYASVHSVYLDNQ